MSDRQGNDQINNLLFVTEQYKKIADDLKTENDILTETVIQNNLGKTAEEKRKDKALIQELRTAIEEYRSKYENMETEYAAKIAKLNETLQDIKDKQRNINAFINKESDKKIADIKKKLKAQEYSNNRILKKEILNNRKVLEQQQAIYKKKSRLLLCITICSILLMAFIVILFLFS